MNPFLIAIIIIFLILGLIYKLNKNLMINKDNVLRALASIDKQLIARNNLLPILLSLAKESMPKETIIINEIYAFRAEVVKLKNRWDNADKRFKFQEFIDEKLNQLIIAMAKYPELKTNFQMSEALKDLAKIEAKLSESIIFYNHSVAALTGSVNNFPSNIIAAHKKITANHPFYNRVESENTSDSYFSR